MHGRRQRSGLGRNRRWVAPFVQGFVITVVLLVGVGTAGAFVLARHYDGNVKRVNNVFGGDDGKRPQKVAKDATNILLVGSDARSNGVQTTGKAGKDVALSAGQRSDALMLVHLPQGRQSAYVISIPRDSWVNIPGHGKNKINSALFFGGPRLLRQTVEGLSGVHIDDYMELDFNGFTKMVNALDGVTIDVPADSYDSSNHKKWTAGVQHMTGSQALLYVRQRHGLANGDFGRMQHQHQFLNAMVTKALNQNIVGHPLAFNSFLNAFTDSVTVDSGLNGGELRGLALSLRDLKKSDVHFMTVPAASYAMEGNQSVVLLDGERDKTLFGHVIADTLSTYKVPAPRGPH